MEHANKNGFMSLCLLIVITFLIDLSSTAEFTYKNADSWVQINPQCGGQRQSPVSLNEEQLVGETDSPIFSLVNYRKKPLSATLMNSGHSLKVEFVWDENQTPYITGGPLDETEYVLDSLNFHWSRSNSNGSEHIVLGYPGALEMHLAHYNRNYGSVKNALDYTDGLAVIGTLFDASSQRRRRDSDWETLIAAASQSSPALGQIINQVESVKTPGSSIDLVPFAIDEFRPVEMDESTYLSYLGSLTTPPCTENVLWLLSTYPYTITQEQLQTLQSTVEFNHEDDHNNRPVQPMNDRTFAVFIGVGRSD